MAKITTLKDQSGGVLYPVTKTECVVDIADNYYTKTQTLDAVFPVNSVYISVSSTSPASLFGGTWARLKDRFLLGAGDTYTNGSTGGEATHTLTTTEMPSHTHYLGITESGGAFLGTNAPGGIMANNANSIWDTNGAFTDRAATSYPSDKNNISTTGGGQAHNNMPPYLVVYMWKRTA